MVKMRRCCLLCLKWMKGLNQDCAAAPTAFYRPPPVFQVRWKTGNSGNPGTMASCGIWLDCCLFMLTLNLRQFCSKGCVLWSYTVGFVSKSDTSWHVFFEVNKKAPCVDIAIELDELLWKTFAEAQMLWYLKPQNISYWQHSTFDAHLHN